MKEYFDTDKYWGMEVIVNIGDCDINIISDESKLREFVKELCQLIDMKTVGEPVLKRFGSEHLYGYSLMQLIETSSIIGHFSEQRREAYLNIFSCKWFDGGKASVFCKKFFGAEKISWMEIVRDVEYYEVPTEDE